jgi:small subunit ribosomal protein S18
VTEETPRPYGRSRDGKRPFGGRSSNRRPMRKRVFQMPAEKKGVIDYKDTEFLSRYTTDRGKIMPRGLTGATAKRQRELARAVHKARSAGLLRITN